jgi:hypothetical protein
MGIYNIIPGANLVGREYAVPALPMLGGRLYAAYLLGDAFARNDGDPALDISTLGRDALLNSAVADDYAVHAADTGYATTQFSTADLVGDEHAATLISICTILSDAAAVALLSSGTVQPYIAQIADPSTGFVRGFNNADGGSENAALSIAANIGSPVAVVTTHSSSGIQTFKRSAGVALSASALVPTARVPAGTGVFRIGDFQAASSAILSRRAVGLRDQPGPGCVQRRAC